MKIFEELYYYPFLASFLFCVGLMFILVWVSKRFEIKGNRNSERHIHSKNISRLGGVAVIVSFLAVIFLNSNLVMSTQLWGVMIASLIILIFGLWDDFWELDWKTQFFFQVAVAVLIFIMGVRVEYITNPLGGLIFLNLGKYLVPSLVFVIVWIAVVINAMNWLDGMDGLSGGTSLIGMMTIFFLSLRPEVNQPPVGVIAMTISGAILGFLVFNFHPAKILAGTTGSMFFGFSLAVLAIFSGAKIATALLVMTPAIVDFVWVIGERIRSGKSIFKADNRHFHHKLKEMGWSQTKISLFFYCLTILIAIIALNTKAVGKLISFILVSTIMILILIYLNRKFIKNRLTKNIS